MRYCSFKYSLSENIGDEIQSLAAEQFLPRWDGRVERDDLGHVPGPEPHLVIMNGWFTHYPQNWPPSAWVVPVFCGFHLHPRDDVLASLLSPRSVEYLQRFAPIGCRDRVTRDRLLQAGVQAFNSTCLTLTFPKRQQTPHDGKVFLVDLPPDFRAKLPRELAARGIVVSHYVQDLWGEDIKFQIARRLLSLYREQAELVVTTRLHCALPCLAMGIPVVFVKPREDSRFSVLQDLGVKMWPLNAASAEIDWRPPVLEIEEHKSRLRAMVQEMVSSRVREGV